MLEWNSQRPESAVAADHRRRSGHQQRLVAVEGLRSSARSPVDRVLEVPGHRRVVFGRRNDEGIRFLDAPAELARRSGKSLSLLDVAVVGWAFELAHVRAVDDRALLLR